MRTIKGAVCALLMMTPAVQAQDYQILGYGYQVTNDLLGDGHDRWRTGSFQGSMMLGRNWQDQVPVQFGDLLELRFNGEIAAPDNLENPADDDRPFAGVLRLGAHTHLSDALSRARFDMGIGAEAVGPQTGLDEFQANFHRLIGAEDASDETRSGQIEDEISAYAHFEANRPVYISQTSQVVPFIEGRAGLETYARVGADLEFGGIVNDEVRVRDYVTGQTYTTVRSAANALTFVVGGDFAYMEESALLPDDRGYNAKEERARVRSGVQWRGQRTMAAFGVTYLSEEFEEQDSGQLLGSFRFKYDF